jgi:hypothetical protein
MTRDSPGCSSRTSCWLVRVCLKKPPWCVYEVEEVAIPLIQVYVGVKAFELVFLCRWTAWCGVWGEGEDEESKGEEGPIAPGQLPLLQGVRRARVWCELVFLGARQTPTRANLYAYIHTHLIVQHSLCHYVIYHTFLHVHIYTHTHIYKYIYAHTHIYIYIYTHTHIYTHIHTHTYI